MDLRDDALLLDGLFNLRDVGGLPLADGGETGSGILYRSDAPANLTPAGREALAESRIGVVVDLRTDSERETSPSLLPAAIRAVELPIRAGSMLDTLADLGRTAPSRERILGALDALPSPGELYVMMMESSAPLFAEVARLVALPDADDRPALLVHCTAGKDRTGVATALVLEAAGVRRDAVVADYAATERHLAGPWAEGMLAAIAAHGLPLVPPLRLLVTGSPREAMEHALAWVDAEFGGAAGYLAHGGLENDELVALRARLAAPSR